MSILGTTAKVISAPLVKPITAAVSFVKSPWTYGAASLAAVGIYLNKHKDPIPEQFADGIAELDALGQQNAAMLNTQYAAQQMSPMAMMPHSRISANDAHYEGGKAFAGAQMAHGAAR